MVIERRVETLAIAATGAETSAGEFRVEGVYPNPCNPSAEVRFSLPAESRVTVRVYNLLGQSVATLVDGTLAGGDHHAVWNTGAEGSGVYFMSIQGTPADGGRTPFRSVVKILVQK